MRVGSDRHPRAEGHAHARARGVCSHDVFDSTRRVAVDDVVEPRVGTPEHTRCTHARRNSRRMSQFETDRRGARPHRSASARSSTNSEMRCPFLVLVPVCAKCLCLRAALSTARSVRDGSYFTSQKPERSVRTSKQHEQTVAAVSGRMGGRTLRNADPRLFLLSLLLLSALLHSPLHSFPLQMTHRTPPCSSPALHGQQKKSPVGTTSIP
jgi:hypothetical protein